MRERDGVVRVQDVTQYLRHSISSAETYRFRAFTVVDCIPLMIGADGQRQRWMFSKFRTKNTKQMHAFPL